MSQKIIPPNLRKLQGPGRSVRFDRIVNAITITLLVITIGAIYGALLAPMMAAALSGEGMQ